EHRVELHSRQPAGSRTYASTGTCTPDNGFTQCRIITGTVAQEALISGDRVVVIERARLTATGANLEGDLDIEVTSLTAGAGTAFAGSATTTTTITPPSGASITSANASFPVSVAAGEGIGTYTVRSV